MRAFRARTPAPRVHDLHRRRAQFQPPTTTRETPMAGPSTLKLDIFPHIFPLPYFERMQAIAQANAPLAGQIKRWLNIPVLWDLDARIRMMKRFPGYRQGVTLWLPAIEFLPGPPGGPGRPPAAHSGMAEICAKH